MNVHATVADRLLFDVKSRMDSAIMWQAFDAKARSQESAYERAALAQLSSESAAVVRMLEQHATHHKAATNDALTVSVIWPFLEAAFLKILAAYAATGTFYRQWYNRFRPLVVKTMGQADVPRVRVGILGPTSPQVLSAIQQRVTKLTGNVTQTTAQQIRDVITQARADGVGVSELSTRIRSEVFSDTITSNRATTIARTTSNRATTIARTETVGALNEGAWVKATSTPGLFRAKMWVSQADGRVRDTHLEAASQGWIPINDQHSNGLLYPHEPGAPADEVVNCRCTEKFTDLTADEANRGAG